MYVVLNKPHVCIINMHPKLSYTLKSSSGRLESNGFLFDEFTNNLKYCLFVRQYEHIPPFACPSCTLFAHEIEKNYRADKKALAFSFAKSQLFEKLLICTLIELYPCICEIKIPPNKYKLNIQSVFVNYFVNY